MRPSRRLHLAPEHGWGHWGRPRHVCGAGRGGTVCIGGGVAARLVSYAPAETRLMLCSSILSHPAAGPEGRVPRLSHYQLLCVAIRVRRSQRPGEREGQGVSVSLEGDIQVSWETGDAWAYASASPIPPFPHRSSPQSYNTLLTLSPLRAITLCSPSPPTELQHSAHPLPPHGPL